MNRNARDTGIPIALLLVVSVGGVPVHAAEDALPDVRILPLPEGALVPDVMMDGAGVLHMVYGLSDDAWYVRSADNGRTFSSPVKEDDEIYPAAFGDGKGHVLLVWQVGPMAVGRTATVKWALYRSDGTFPGRQGTLGVSTSGTKATAFLGTEGAFYIAPTAK